MNDKAIEYKSLIDKIRVMIANVSKLGIDITKYNNRLELRAENPTYEPLNYEGLELENIRILGKAVAFQSYVK